MKHWKVYSEDGIDTYFIAREEGFSLLHLPLGADLQSVLVNDSTAHKESLSCEQMDQLICTDNENVLDFEAKDAQYEDLWFETSPLLYREIKAFILAHYSPITVNKLTPWHYVRANMVALTIGILIVFAGYASAVAYEVDQEPSVMGNRGLLRSVIIWFAGMLGKDGVLIVGLLFVLLMIYLTAKKFINPNKGHIISFAKETRGTF